MSAILRPLRGDVVYPDSDGKPMAENTLQFEWITTIQGNLDLLYLGRDDVFVAGDNLIYPVEGDNTICQAPDVYVAFGRPKGHRGSYKVWDEGGVFPQVIFEVLSPGNRRGEMAQKFLFYQHYGVEEYYVYDPDRVRLEVSVRGESGLDDVRAVNGWVSPLLGVRFTLTDETLRITYPDGRPFLTFVELGERVEAERRRADTAERRADTAEQRADAERKRADALRAKLRELGIDPDAA